ncbi:DEAD/DEAH box helicase [Shewanella sp. cp20]|uniref:DEAD/DEAH box helicase n=1 Tax=Shewanella sp. cp20 TaxID=1521167 RepID=UPI00059FC304|nr:type ISP restriction/modification enzyme [Shewanella sp. cp20]KIO36326.1 damage-inducible protein [Shewanella sp. cp20]
MTALEKLLAEYRQVSRSEREKGTYFEELIQAYFKNEPTYADLYCDVWMYKNWAKEYDRDGKDVGIDLVAKTRDTNEYHAIQCKCYDESYRLQKKDIDSFFTASGQAPFSHRIIVSTTNNWSSNAEAALIGQNPPVTRIDLQALEDSVIDWSKYQPDTTVQIKVKNKPRPHQQTAITKVKEGLAKAERGTLLMACGTGKTFTSLKIAEELAGAGKRVLFLVPSLSLLSQTLTEWTQHSEVPLHSFAVCSDSDVGKKRNANEDTVQTFTHELRYPATTNAKRLAEEVAKRQDSSHMSVVFSTYHSIEVIANAQNEFGLAPFDLIICDEAHRTTGATFAGEDESAFVRVHDKKIIHGIKRLYMTATPRIYGEAAKASADKGDVALASMDDESLFGKNLHTLTFSEAVSRGLLCDYKVIVLTMDEHHVTRRIQSLLKDENNTIKVDDAAKIIGCWKALSKHQMKEGLELDPEPMKRAVAFCQVIERNTGKTHKVSSKQIAEMFQAVVESYQEHENDADDLVCEVQHVDGSMNATEKESKINWLKAQPEENNCKILSNVRCLSEGVDVPALDAVLFLTPRNSQVDVVQSVGRVMRNAPGKVRGYVILPVVIPNGMSPNEALNDNQTYRVVWEVLQALRSHDDRFDAMINKLDLTGNEPKKMEIVAINDRTVAAYKGQKTKQRKKAALVGKAKQGHIIGSKKSTPPSLQGELALDFEVGEIERALVAKIVDKCGNRHHWEEWAKDIAKIAQTHISRIKTIVTSPENKAEKAAFKAYVEELRDDLNDAITEEEVIEMLAQHLITEPVFEALFEGYSFSQSNPVSQAMDKVVKLLHEHNLDNEADTLEGFYASVKMRADGIDNAAAKQKIIVELYDKFFRNAFPRLTERLGIVYTPVEVVDFIIHSINHLLKTEFGQELGSDGVHILDPFTGTGTFITRLLQSGLISQDQLPHKYAKEIHANELVLLAYYIAAINIEAVYHSLVGDDYKPFPGICLTDTFQMYEHEDRIQDRLAENSRRRTAQRNLKDIRVIMGNPPYSIGQRSENDNNDNVEYPILDAQLANTYVKKSNATLSKGMYDSYIRAFRWASDRLGERGVVGFVTNGGFVEANTSDGMRKCLAEEFSNIWIFHLRGNARTSGELRRKEKDNVFGQGTRTPIAITLLVKNPDASKHGQIYFHDIGDYLSREEKLAKIADFVSIAGISENDGWTKIVPDTHGDWLNQRDDSFNEFIVLGAKGNSSSAIFDNYTQGVLTSRDAWCYNPSKNTVARNMEKMINFYNNEVSRLQATYPNKSPKELANVVDQFVNSDSTEISWSRALKKELTKCRQFMFRSHFMVKSLYRPFTKQWVYFNRNFNEMVYQLPKIFPNQSSDNIVICILGSGSKKEFSCIVSDLLPNYDNLEKGQCFPLYLYDEDGSNKRDAITDDGLTHFQSYYPSLSLSKGDIFYYIYGLLHSGEYRNRYGDNLSKDLPRIPRVNKAEDFLAFSQAGRALAKLHLDYESAPCYKATLDSSANEDSHYRVLKMKHPKVKVNGKSVNDKSTIIYNDRITIKDIPENAYRYVVNGKPAIDWVMERQCVKTDKASDIENDANLWAAETMNNPKYPLELVLRVITVSLETMKIVDALPALHFD